MMTKMKSPQLAKIKVLLFIPLTAILLMAFSNPEPLMNPVVEKVQSLTQQITNGQLPSDFTSQNTSDKEKGTITIKGKVVDGSTSKPLEGVNIVVSGTTTGTTSDAKGNFEIRAISAKMELAFSYVGYATVVKEFTTSGKANIQMMKSAMIMDEVTVKYPGENQNVEIKPYPYVLVDGVPTDEETFKALDPNLIESVSVFKDEKATAAYGEKGKNGVIVIVMKKGNTAGEEKVAENQKDNSSAIFMVVEEMPKYPGGENEQIKFFSNNLKIPAEGLKKGIEGTVYVSFVVKEDGSVANAKVLRGLGKSYDEEVLRVINLMPKWLPGIQNGKHVAVQINLPVKFAKK